MSARESGRIGHATSLQNLVQRGEAATLEEAQKVLSGRGHAASLQRLVESGEAATLKEAQKALSSRGRDAMLQKMVDSGEAATLKEAQELVVAHMLAAATAKDPLGATGFAMRGGVTNAIKAGKYSRFPGVRWRKDSQKWRVQFSVKGKQVSLGSYASEEEAAHVHDEYVRTNNLSRPLHFPQSGEVSSSVLREKMSRKEGLPP